MVFFLGVLRGLAVRILTVERRNRDYANALPFACREPLL
jgi:hypothetical protein